MAGIFKRGSTWWGRVQKKGVQHRRSLETRSESVARERLAKWLQELDAIAWGAKPRFTLNEVADRFIREHGPTIKPSSLRRYVISLTHFDEHMGERVLADITPGEFKAFETWRRSKGATAPTIVRDFGALSSLYSFAIEHEWVEHNPVSAYLKTRRKRGLKNAAPRQRYLTRNEEARLMISCVPYVRDAVLVAIYSGLRSEEQFALTWDRVNLQRGTVTIPAEMSKTGRERTVVLLQPAIDVLSKMPRHMRSKFVFHHGAFTTKGRGAPREDRPRARATNDGERFNHLSRGLKRAAERAKVPGIRWHDLRRTHGCRLLQDEGWSMEMVRDQLGHTSVVQTERAYAFLEIDARIKARTKVGTEIQGDLSGGLGAQPDDLVAQKPSQGARHDLKKRGGK
jgi:integrase/recombinase XerD